MSLVSQMSAQMAKLLQVHFSSVNLVLFDLAFFFIFLFFFYFILVDHKSACAKWAHAFAHACSFCERDPGEQSRKPPQDFLRVFLLHLPSLSWHSVPFSLAFSVREREKSQPPSLIAMHLRNILPSSPRVTRRQKAARDSAAKWPASTYPACPALGHTALPADNPSSPRVSDRPYHSRGGEIKKKRREKKNQACSRRGAPLSAAL